MSFHTVCFVAPVAAFPMKYQEAHISALGTVRAGCVTS